MSTRTRALPGELLLSLDGELDFRSGRARAGLAASDKELVGSFRHQAISFRIHAAQLPGSTAKRMCRVWPGAIFTR